MPKRRTSQENERNGVSSLFTLSSLQYRKLKMLLEDERRELGDRVKNLKDEKKALEEYVHQINSGNKLAQLK